MFSHSTLAVLKISKMKIIPQMHHIEEGRRTHSFSRAARLLLSASYMYSEFKSEDFTSCSVWLNLHLLTFHLYHTYTTISGSIMHKNQLKTNGTSEKICMGKVHCNNGLCFLKKYKYGSLGSKISITININTFISMPIIFDHVCRIIHDCSSFSSSVNFQNG